MADLAFLERYTFLAIDAGSEWTGYCAAVGSGQLLFSGRENIKRYTRRKGGDPTSVWSRVEHFGLFVTSLVYVHRPDFLIMELPTGDHDNRHTDRVMGSMLGVLDFVASLADARRVICTPHEVKATGYHKGAKRDAALLAGVKPEEMTDDWADALGLWQAGMLKVRDVGLRGVLDFAAIDVVDGDSLYVVERGG